MGKFCAVARYFFGLLLFASLLAGQTPVPEAAAHEVKDALGRGTPQSSVVHFLEACHARDYSKAFRYLDLRRVPLAQRSKDGPDLAKQLEDLLDDTPFDITSLSNGSEGDQSDGLSTAREHLASFKVGSDNLDLQLERVELKPGLPVWIVSADSVALIPKAHRIVAETPFEKYLPQ